jgi:sugar/nucleoside kinase (ribokinase family)
MKLLVIGHSVLDYIKSEKADKKSPGGIYYSISTLNRLCNNEDEIFLCSQYDEETYNFFKPEFEIIKKDYLNKVKRIPRVHLNLFKDKERYEAYENITTNLITDFIDYKKFDGILINMITGFDITLNQLYDIRKNYSGLIFLDVHTLSRGLDENYKREFRKIPDFENWANNVDIIQVNQSELFTLSDKNSEIEIVNEIFTYGVKFLCVTKGEVGAKIYSQKTGEIHSYFVAAKKINNPNVIGCGDVFGSAFFYNYIKTKNEMDSLDNAVKTAEQHVNNKLF